MGISDGSVVGVTKIVDHGSEAERFDLVIIGDGYRASELTLYHNAVQSFIDELSATSPWDEMWAGVNVHRIDVVSTDSGADDPGCGGNAPVVANTYFDATFCTNFAGTPLERLLTINDALALSVANTYVPLKNQVVCIVNSTKYGGSGGAVAVCSVESQANKIAIHEMGHSIFGLGDEYGGDGTGTPVGEPSQPNVTRDTNRSTNKWAAFIAPTTPMPSGCDFFCVSSSCVPPITPPPAYTVGTYEGAIFSDCNTYRPFANCIMRDLSDPFCPVCASVIRTVLQPFQPIPFYAITIAGEAKDIQTGWSIYETVNGRASFSCAVLSKTGSYRPAIGAEVIFTKNGTRIFGGFISTPAEQGIGKGYTIITRISAVDYTVLADRRFVQNGGFPAGFTLLAALTSLVGYLTPYGVTLDPAQVTGPTLPLLGYDVRSISSILDELSVITGFIWEIDYNKVLRMHAIGAVAAPFNITTAAGILLGDPTTESEREKYANRVIVRAGSGTVLVENERHLGNGVARRFALDAHAAQLFGVVNIYRAGVFQQGLPVGIYGSDDLPWTFDANTNELVQRADQVVLAATVDYIEMTYNGAFPISVMADAGAAPEDLVERVIDAPEVFSRAVAQALANGELARALDVSQTVRYATVVGGLSAGQSQAITIPERAASGSFLITDVETRHLSADVVKYFVTATGGSQYHGSYRDTLRALGGGSSGSSTAGSVTIVNSGVSGSGTANQLSKWISSTLLADSIINELGSIVTVGGALNVIGTVSAPLFSGSGANLTSLPAEQLTGNMPWPVLPLGVGTWTGSPTITGALTVNSQVSVNDTITTPPLTNLNVSPTGDLVLDPSGNDVLPGSGYDINLGMLSKKYLSIHAAELWVETLVAQNTLATIGGRILVAPTNILALDLGPAETVITVKYNSLAVGDILYMEANGQVEFMTVTAVVGTAEVPWLISGSISLLFSPPSATYTAYTYSVTRNTDGTGANQWYAGDALLNTGQVGNGFIDLYSVRGVKSGSEAGPTIVGNVRTSTSFNGWAPRWAIGNLNGLYGYGATTYGSAFGDPSGANVTVDATNGVRNRIGTTVYSQLTGSTFTIGLSGGNRMQWDGTNLTVVSSTVSIDSSGVAIATPGTSYAASFSYKFTPNATIGGSTWGTFGKNADSVNRYLGIQNVVATNGKNAWIEMLSTGKTSGGSDVNSSLSLFSDGAVTGVSSATLTAGTISLSGAVNALNSLTVQGSSGVSVYYGLTVGAGATVDPLLVQVNGTNKCRFDSNGDLRPETDSTQHVGVPSKRFAYMTALSFNTTDVGLENGWSLTESYRIGVSEPGVGLVDDEGQLVAFFGKDQTYLKTLASVDDLPFAVTTLDERIHMDPTPELRVKDYDEDGQPIFKTADDVIPFPGQGDIQSNNHRNNIE